MKHGFDNPLKLGFVVLSKYLVITSMSSGLPYFDSFSFSVLVVRSELFKTKFINLSSRLVLDG